MSIVRCDNEGNELVKIASLKQNKYNNTKFEVTYFDETQDAKDDVELAKIEKAKYVAGEFDVKSSAIGISDMFYSDEMTCRETNSALYPGFQYRVVPTEENPNKDLTCVVSFAPVFKTNENIVTRANYSQAEVDADVDNTLEENDKAKINFTPNMAKAMTEYRVYKGDATQGTIFYNIESSAIVLDNNFLSQAFEDDIQDGTVYVPELYTEYNDNTYGCYKQSVSDANLTIKVENMVAADFVNNDGKRYVHATLSLQSIINNTDKDSRYLLRVWRQVGNAEKVLLNGSAEAWETNYAGLSTLGMEADDYAKTDNNTFTLYDTFEAVAQAPASGAPGLKKEGDMVNIEDVKYFATLYVKDDASEKYYVKTTYDVPETSIPTAISTIDGSAQVESVRYINVAGMESDKPFAGMNIVVTRYSNGTTTITKMIK